MLFWSLPGFFPGANDQRDGRGWLIDAATPPVAQHRLLAFSRSAGHAVGTTKLLEIALTRAAKLSEAEQDRIARLALDETLDEARWQATSAGSQEKLARLAERARGDLA